MPFTGIQRVALQQVRLLRRDHQYHGAHPDQVRRHAAHRPLRPPIREATQSFQSDQVGSAKATKKSPDLDRARVKRSVEAYSANVTALINPTTNKPRFQHLEMTKCVTPALQERTINHDGEP